MVIELLIVQFWSEIILVISNRTRAARSFDFETRRMISDQIILHSVQLPLYIPAAILNFGERVDCKYSLFCERNLRLIENVLHPTDPQFLQVPKAGRAQTGTEGAWWEVPLFSHDAHRS